ncbi:DUF1381 domain-containing protein [Staphylococcus pseudintermedius]|nr:DUF1381 domain-containing protein [Staphylococcus pseudintermedius]
MRDKTGQQTKTKDTCKDILTKARENQSFEVVEAESKEEAIKKYESPKVKQQVIACNMPDWA